MIDEKIPVSTDVYCNDVDRLDNYFEKRERVAKNLGALTNHRVVHLEKPKDKKPADMGIIKE